MKNKDPFIPKDKPKSWVLFILCGSVCLLLAGPLIFVGMYYEIKPVQIIGTVIFMSCWLIAMVSGFVFLSGSSQGKYKNLKEESWNKQLW